MVRENGETFETLFDEKRFYKLLSVQEEGDIFIFRAELIDKSERGMSDGKPTGTTRCTPTRYGATQGSRIL